eukprot:Rmarinus@m.10949
MVKPKLTREEKNALLAIAVFEKREKTKERKRKIQERVKNRELVIGTAPVPDIPEVTTYRPTCGDFRDPLEYIERISAEASKQGVCKIVVPPDCRNTVSLPKSFRFPIRKQTLGRVQCLTVHGNEDAEKNVEAAEEKLSVLQYAFPEAENEMTIDEFKRFACGFEAKFIPDCASRAPKVVESEFWRLLHGEENQTVWYGLDVEESCSDACAPNSKLNLNNINESMRSLLHFEKTKMPGVTSPMLYIGQAFSRFCWHHEDFRLYSCSYHHGGAAKTWYGVPGSAAEEFEAAVGKYLPPGKEGTAAKVLASKTVMFSPEVALQAGVPVYRAVQTEGELIVTFPRAYHAGFSHGFNITEAVNFALVDWLQQASLAAEYHKSNRLAPLFSYEEMCVRAAIGSVREPLTEKVLLSCDVGSVLDRLESLRSSGSGPSPTAALLLAEHIRTIRKHELYVRSRLPKMPQLHGYSDEVYICDACQQPCFLSVVITPGHALCPKDPGRNASVENTNEQAKERQNTKQVSCLKHHHKLSCHRRCEAKTFVTLIRIELLDALTVALSRFASRHRS